MQHIWRGPGSISGEVDVCRQVRTRSRAAGAPVLQCIPPCTKTGRRKPYMERPRTRVFLVETQNASRGRATPLRFGTYIGTFESRRGDSALNIPPTWTDMHTSDARPGAWRRYRITCRMSNQHSALNIEIRTAHAAHMAMFAVTQLRRPSSRAYAAIARDNLLTSQDTECVFHVRIRALPSPQSMTDSQGPK